jgi:hypothetical protein
MCLPSSPRLFQFAQVGWKSQELDRNVSEVTNEMSGPLIQVLDMTGFKVSCVLVLV